MKMSESRISYLLKVYSHGNASEKEQKELFDWVAEGDEMPIKKHIEELVNSYERNSEIPSVDWERLYTNIIAEKNHRAAKPIVKKINWLRWSAAAAIILLTGTIYYFLQHSSRNQHESPQTALNKVNDIKPPSSVNAFITLSDGNRVRLDSLAKGTIALQGNVSVVKLADGRIAYNPVNEERGISNAKTVYNTLTNPAGSRVVNITLSDGTKVWLNAKSSLTYPAIFAANDRRVKITGEAYFEVAPLLTGANEKGGVRIPFHVDARGVDIEVLGTHFNINSYDDETNVRTTLLEGSVRVSKGTSERVINPGEQAETNPKSASGIKVIEPNVSEVMAWKNGRFSYSNSDLETIMRQTSRWYDVDVIYRDKINDHYTVNVPNNIPVSQLFKFIEMSGGVHFEIVGKKILVEKK